MAELEVVRPRRISNSSQLEGTGTRERESILGRKTERRSAGIKRKVKTPGLIGSLGPFERRFLGAFHPLEHSLTLFLPLLLGNPAVGGFVLHQIGQNRPSEKDHVFALGWIFDAYNKFLVEK